MISGTITSDQLGARNFGMTRTYTTDVGLMMPPSLIQNPSESKAFLSFACEVADGAGKLHRKRAKTEAGIH
jgi:hypothetical protein